MKRTEKVELCLPIKDGWMVEVSVEMGNVGMRTPSHLINVLNTISVDGVDVPSSGKPIRIYDVNGNVVGQWRCRLMTDVEQLEDE